MLHPPPLVATAAEFAKAGSVLEGGTGPIACDVERADEYVYETGAYLIQLARAGSGVVLVDPRSEDAPAGLAALQPLLTSEEVVFHAADGDLQNMRALDLAPTRIFDTLVAAELLNYPKLGLAALVEEIVGVSLSKKLQRSNWSVRPLPADQLAYAALDVAYLNEVRDRLAADLVAAGKDAWARQECAHILETVPEPVPEEDRWRIRGASKLRTPAQRGALRELWYARDQIAAQRNLSPARVCPPSALLALAESRPRTVAAALSDVPRLRQRSLRRWVKVWVEALERARTLDPADLPRGRPGGARFPHEALSGNEKARLAALKQARDSVTDRLDIRREIAVNALMLETLVREDTPASEVADRLAELGARPWQVEQFAPALGGVLAQN